MERKTSTIPTNEDLRKDANFYKVIFIDHFLSKHNPDLIANEVTYGRFRKICDLVFIENGKTFGIEIKSELDNDMRMLCQLQESKKSFDYVIAFVPYNLVDKVKDYLPEGIGLYYYNNGKIRKYIKEHKQSLDLLEIAYSIPISYLKRHFKVIEHLDADNYRKRISQKYPNKIRLLFLQFLTQRYSGRFRIFQSERQDFTHIDDLELLSIGEIIQ